MDIEILTFNVSEADTDSRLDAFLASQIPAWSRARLQRLVESEDVLVNEKTVKSSYRLRVGDVIEVELAAPESQGFSPEEIPIEVIYEDDDLVVVNKPAGLVVHPAAGMM